MEKLACDVCGRKFKTADALTQHKNDAHKQPQSEAKTDGKKTLSKGKIFAILIPALFVAVVAYGIFWAVTGENIGPIGSTHIHADFAIFMNGEQLTPLPREFFVLSPYIHIEGGPGEGTVMHTHATNVPLKMFFKSLGINFNPQCFDIGGGKKYCNGGGDTLKMFVKHTNSTWERNYEYEAYIFKDLDKILITYGHETDKEIRLQQNNVTDFSKDNSGRGMALRR